MLGLMPSLIEKLTEHGFESNDDYEFQVRCLLETPTSGIRALNIEGDGERRKTAFANALARALDFPQILYHDFTVVHPPLPDVILPPNQDELRTPGSDRARGVERSASSGGPAQDPGGCTKLARHRAHRAFGRSLRPEPEPEPRTALNEPRTDSTTRRSRHHEP